MGINQIIKKKKCLFKKYFIIYLMKIYLDNHTKYKMMIFIKSHYIPKTNFGFNIKKYFNHILYLMKLTF